MSLSGSSSGANAPGNRYYVAGSTTAGPSAGLTADFHPNSHTTVVGADNVPPYVWIVPVAGTVDLLRVTNAGAFDGNDSLAAVVRKNGSSTTLTATIPLSSGAGTVVSDITNSFQVVANDFLQIRLTSSATGPVAGSYAWIMRFTPS